MKESILITDEAYHRDIARFWRACKRLRNSPKYGNVKFTLKSWLLTCDDQIVKHNATASVSLTALVAVLAVPPTNGELLEIMSNAGEDVKTDLPVRVTGLIEIEYDVIP